MGKYYQLQCKRMLRSLPGIFLAMLVLIGSIALAYRLFVGQNALREKNNRFIFAICGETDNSFLQMGISAFGTLDTSRFALDIREMDEPEAEQALSNGEISAYAIIPEGFMEAAFAGEILPIQFCSTTGAAGIVSLVKEELSEAISTLLLESQKGVYGMWDTMIDNGLRDRTGGQMDRLALVYVDHILVRDRMYTVEELGIGDALGLEGYLLCGLGVLLLLLLCLPFAAQMIPGDPALGRMLCAKQKPAWQQAMCDFLAYATGLVCLLLPVCVAAMVLKPDAVDFATLWRTAPVVLFAVAFSFMLYSLSRDMIGGVLLQFFVTVVLCFVSGCLYPVHFFPVQLQQLARWLPTGIARAQLASCITGTAPVGTWALLLGYCTVFIAVGVMARVRHIQGVKR